MIGEQNICRQRAFIYHRRTSAGPSNAVISNAVRLMVDGPYRTEADPRVIRRNTFYYTAFFMRKQPKWGSDCFRLITALTENALDF